jgi:hypothetical protein
MSTLIMAFQRSERALFILWVKQAPGYMDLDACPDVTYDATPSL